MREKWERNERRTIEKERVKREKERMSTTAPINALRASRPHSAVCCRCRLCRDDTPRRGSSTSWGTRRRWALLSFLFLFLFFLFFLFLLFFLLFAVAFVFYRSFSCYLMLFIHSFIKKIIIACLFFAISISCKWFLFRLCVIHLAFRFARCGDRTEFHQYVLSKG